MVFYEGRQFPAEYRGDAFVAEHGSWNRAKRTGSSLRHHIQRTSRQFCSSSRLIKERVMARLQKAPWQ
jgi:glucose/arabinose dehydrogenase